MNEKELVEIAKALRKKLGIATVWTPYGYMPTREAMNLIIAGLEQTNAARD